MKAFHNDPKIKKKYLDRLKAHQIADEIIKGVYWENGKGCAVGCTIHSGSHKSYENELGIPMILARLEDRIFENLPNGTAKSWPIRFLESIPVGADLSLVWDRFASALMVDTKIGVIQYAETEDQIEIIQRVYDFYEAKIIGIEVPEKEWWDSRTAATAAAAAAATATAAATAYAAEDAAEAAAATAAATAYAAEAAAAAAATAAAAAYAAYAATAAAYAARTQCFIDQSELLLKLLSETK